MKKMIYVFVTAITVFAFVNVNTLSGQEWSKDQKAVWQEVENGWKAWKSGDSNGAFKGVHEKYLGWNHDDPMPISKAKWKNQYEMWSSYMKVQYYDLEPARIVVEDNSAVVYYYFEFSSVIDKDGMKKNRNMEGRNVEFYVKDGGDWMLLGDMTYFEGDDD